MFEISYATNGDIPIWLTFDKHISQKELGIKIANNRCYMLRYNENPIGVMRYNLFWDEIPFLTLIHFGQSFRGKGYGTKALKHWEGEMGQAGFTSVMTSTSADEQGQFFYRKHGYKDCGVLLLGDTLREPAEIFLMKDISPA